jgi:putative ABC transport system permease protein
MLRDLLSDLRFRVRALFRRGDVERELAAELRFHVEVETDRLVREGLSVAEAQRQARLSLGGIEQVKEATRDARGLTWLERFSQDLRYAVRGLRRNPSFTAVAVLTLSLGIGLSTAVFTVADALLIRRLPIRDQDRVVVLTGEFHGRSNWGLGLNDAREFERETRSLDQVAFVSYYNTLEKPIRERERVFHLRESLVSGDLFDVLGAHPALGRTLRPADDVIGAEHVVVLSYLSWRRNYGLRADILGQQFRTYDDGMTFTIVGVMPQGFDYPRGTDFWAPGVASTAKGNPVYNALHVVGRLKHDATAGQARDDITAFFSRPEAPAWQHNLHGVVQTLPQLVVGDTKPALLIFAAAAGLLLLITCINVANLLLVRGLARAREIAVRSALGGSRRRIVAQLLTECTLLAALGGAAGVGIAALAVRMFVAFAPPGVPRLDEIHLNATALLGAVAITAFALLVFALAPAVSTSRVELPDVLRSDTRLSASPRSRLVSEALVVAQVALALVVLSSAALIARSLLKLEAVNLSFESSHLLIGELSLRFDSLESKSSPVAMLDRLIPRLQAVPGVQTVSPVVAVPFSGSHGWDGSPSVEGQSSAEIASNPVLNMEVVAPAYFATFGIPIVRGRAFTDADREGTPDVVVLSQSAARHFWPHDDAIGKRVLMGAKAEDSLTVVGVVPDTRYRDLRDARPSIYFPLRQSFFPTPMTLAIRATGPPADIVASIQRVMDETEPDVTLISAAPFDSFLAGPLAQPRLNALLLGIFASAALALATIGLFGVVATMVRQRTREFGIRMALGADSQDVRRLVIRRGLAIAAPGIVLGLCGALLVNHLLTTLLYEVSPTDGATLATVSGLLLLIALAASLIPAHASTRIDPTDALRAE